MYQHRRHRPPWESPTVEIRVAVRLNTVYSLIVLGDRSNIADALEAEVRWRIVDGRLPPGDRLNEVHLAQELRISRTPLREALTRLAGQGLIDVIPRRGFFVRPLTSREAREIYPIRPLLDPAALRLAGIPSRQVLRELRVLDRKLRRAVPDIAAVVDADEAWHRALLAHCPNQHLLDLIQQHITLTRRYELAWFRCRGAVPTASDEHERVVCALEEGDLESACDHLYSNLTTCLAPLCAWLDGENTQ
ncbi:MAG: GntR family transcriptional regulator [Pseudomonadota bacterium]